VRRVELVQLGLGYVGRSVAQIIIEERKRWREQFNLDLHYRAVSDTSGALIGEELLPQAIRLKENGGKLAELGEVEPVEEILISEPAPGTTRIVVDLAVHGTGTFDLDLLGVKHGACLVLSNKGPLSGSSAEYSEIGRASCRERVFQEV
jgi:homoserine dehydrogenase